MLAKLLFLIALVLFILAALDANVHNAVDWGLAAVAAGLLVDGFVWDHLRP